MVDKLLKNHYLRFYKNKKLTEEHGHLVHTVDAIHKTDSRQLLQVSLIYNWDSVGNPSIKIPYYIDAETLEEICKAIQKKEPPKDDIND